MRALLLLILPLALGCSEDEPTAPGDASVDAADSADSTGSADVGPADSVTDAADDADALADGDAGSETPLLILQRTPRTAVGDAFETSYRPGARLIALASATAGAAVSQVCCESFVNFEGVDIQSFDVALDARSIVFSARVSTSSTFQLYRLALDGAGKPTGMPTRLPLATDRNHLDPVFISDARIAYVTTDVVEPSTPQYRDESERRPATQLATLGLDGSGLTLGPRHLSHRAQPTMLSDGRVLFTQWDHLGSMDEVHLMIANPDLTGVREAFGKEGKAKTAATLKAVEMGLGRLLAIGAARTGTMQAGKLLDVRLGETVSGKLVQAESRSSAIDLTPSVPATADASTVGRYFDAWPLPGVDGKFPDAPVALVSFADGAVSEGATADFGVYRFDAATGMRTLVFDDPALWDVHPRPLSPRATPPAVPAPPPNGYSTTSVLVGSANVYQSSLVTLPAGSVHAVRVIEGFSTEEGVPNAFGLTDHEGAARLGDVPVKTDGSWAALVPANVPLRLQPVDKFGMGLASEPVWIGGRPGESRFCGGCHEDRTVASTVTPSTTLALSGGAAPVALDQARALRRSTVFTRDKIVGVPWTTAVQPILTAKCASCHDGTAGPSNPTWTLTKDSSSFAFTFDLTGRSVDIAIAGATYPGYSASHLSLLGLGPLRRALEAKGVVITGFSGSVKAGDAANSPLIKRLNPPQQYPTQNLSVRAFAGATPHALDVGADLTADEYFLLVLMADLGGQYYARENAPGPVASAFIITPAPAVSAFKPRPWPVAPAFPGR